MADVAHISRWPVVSSRSVPLDLFVQEREKFVLLVFLLFLLFRCLGADCLKLLKLSGSVAGPAGAGKTESVKELARMLGYFCLVFNCSETVDLYVLEKVFAGIHSFLSLSLYVCRRRLFACSFSSSFLASALLEASPLLPSLLQSPHSLPVFGRLLAFTNTYIWKDIHVCMDICLSVRDGIGCLSTAGDRQTDLSIYTAVQSLFELSYLLYTERRLESSLVTNYPQQSKHRRGTTP